MRDAGDLGGWGFLGLARRDENEISPTEFQISIAGEAASIGRERSGGGFLKPLKLLGLEA